MGYGYDIKLAPDWYKKDWENSKTNNDPFIWEIFDIFYISGIFGKQGVEYQDWLDCTIKHPLHSVALN